MFNNEVTYADKWNTPENIAAYEILEKKYFDNSICSPSCPVAWAPEILELMNLFDSELGIKRNTSTMRAWTIKGNALQWFVIDPWKNAYKSIVNNFLKPPLRWSEPLTINEKLQGVAKAFVSSYSYGIKAIKIQTINPYLNKLDKPKLELSQLKEKYGQLVIYFNSPSAFEDWVNNEIRKTELKLAIKGVYYPIESFWDASSCYNVGNDFEPDIITSEVKTKDYGDKKNYIEITKTTYRKSMKELGLDLKDIEIKAMLAAQTKESKI